MRFEKLTSEYKDTVLKWLSKPHVSEFFYGDGLENTLNNLYLYCQGVNDNGQYVFDDWIAFYNNEPFGFLITSAVTGPFDPNDDYNKWFVENKNTFTLDLLIGPSEYLGKGLASIMIEEFIKQEFSKADYFIIDPEKANSKAIHVYEKAGFKKVDEIVPVFNQKPHVMMQLSVKKAIWYEKK